MERENEVKITGLKTNHLTNPLGFDIRIPTVSFRVEETEGKHPEAIRIRAATEPDFSDIVYDSGKKPDIRMAGERLAVDLEPRTRYYWKTEVWADNGDYAESETAWFETAKMDEAWDAKWIGSCVLGESSPVFRKEFTTEKTYKTGRIYVTGLGLYELYLDGERVGNEYLAPGCTDYNQWIQYQTYETEVKPGQHKLEVYLADGWYKGRFGLDKAENVYGDQCMMLLELILKDADGNEVKVVSDESWTVSASDIMSSSIYDGEVYVPSSGKKNWYPAELIDGPTEKLCARYSQPVVVKETRTPKILTTPAGETVLDMEQNMAGFVRFYVDEPKGTRIRMQFGEVLQDGNFYRDNLRTAKAEFVYVSDGIAKEVGPHFTYYGFRYVKVEGFTKEIQAEQFTGCVLYTDLEQTGWISTSDEKVNQLISNAFWGQKCNYVDVPTDCPQRDERMGWTADTQVFSGTACFNMDSYNFLRKFCHDLYETQKELGHVTAVVPAFHEDGPTCSVWGDAATIIPWNLYLYYGDVSILEEQFDSMCRWVDYIKGIDEATGGRRFWDVGFHFGDWLALDGEGDDTFKGSTEDGYIATAYYYNSSKIVSKAAKILGKTEEAAYYGTLAGEIKQAMQAEYFTANGRLALTTQTAYALALYMDFAPEGSKERIAEFLKEKLKVNRGYLKTGFVGTYILNKVLSDYGNNDLAYKLLLNEDCPSWLYAVNMGATTIWERWNSILPDGKISGTEMNSLNHYSYGSVLEWMYRNMAGIHLCEDHPGFEQVLIAPQPDYRITSCDMKYVSVSGTYEIHWKVEKTGEFDLAVEIPFDCCATVKLPNTDQGPVQVESGRHEFRYLPETPIIKVYSCQSSFNDLAEGEKSLAVLEQYVPGWQGVPVPMRDMTLEQLNDTPFVNLTGEQMEAINAQLKMC
ncbi:MAG: glycoside hydrolase family 78 protein [Lachnospiraceae bacterium]|nr:glycoside hydrolase family 78 protein [Lachnospiraceae bacterium]